MSDPNSSISNDSSLVNITTSSSEEECQRKHIAWMFILSSVISFLSLMALVLLYRGIAIILDHRRTRFFVKFYKSRNIVKRKRQIPVKKQSLFHPTWRLAIKEWVTDVVTVQTSFGKYLKCYIFLISMASLVLYFIEAKEEVVEMCNVWNDTTFRIDLFVNICLLIYFFLRMIASFDRLWFLFELHSFVDFLILPPFFLALYLNRSWIGFRALRSFRIVSVPDILDYLNILKRAASVRLAQLCCIFIAVWIGAAGVVHLIENSGDPPHYDNVQPMSYYICFYLVLITMSTVGYGDFSCTTMCGRTFIICFILVGLALFASCIPEIIELIGSKPKYSGVLQLEKDRRHIILCGHITYQSVLHVLRDFIHEDREDEVHLVILNTTEPDLPLETLLKRNFPMVLYFQGSMTNYFDLERVKLHEADACLILADKYAIDPDAEDAANIMRVISIKNYFTDIRVVVQLMLYRNKAYILNIPSFNRMKGDHVICLSEFKLGLFAQSCVAPGFSTMLANLVAMRSFKQSLVKKKWSYSYLKGTGMGLHCEILSNSFVGMDFHEVALFCFTKLKILLVGIEMKDNVKVNPMNHLIIENTVGFFIAQNASEVKRAWYYCKLCHAKIRDENLVGRCKCMLDWMEEMENELDQSHSRPYHDRYDMEASLRYRNKRHQPKKTTTENDSISEEFVVISPQPSFQSVKDKESLTSDKNSQGKKNDGSENGFDSTGMFHWAPAKPFEESVLDRHSNKIPYFKGHVIVCIFAEPNSPVYGLRSFVLPLRASNFQYYELKDIVIIGCIEYLRQEWLWFQNLPKIYLLNGSPLNRADLKAVKIHSCDMCCIVSAKSFNNEDPVLNDKEPILATLNIKSMAYTKPSHELQTGQSASSVSVNTISAQRGGSFINSLHFPILTELYNDTNVVFLDEEEEKPDIDLYLSQPFACGTAFAVSVLDVLMSMTYFNHRALRLVRSLLNNGASRELELTTAEGTALYKGNNSPELLKNRNRCRVDQILLAETPLYKYAEYGQYGDLFVAAIKNYGMLCLGLYRYRDLGSLEHFSDRRYVITNPPLDFILDPTDKVFVLMQFNTNFSNVPEV